MPATLPKQIQDDLDTAIADRDAATAADDTKATASASLAQAQATLDQATAAAVTSHATALASAHVVIDELTALLQAQPALQPIPQPAGTPKK